MPELRDVVDRGAVRQALGGRLDLLLVAKRPPRDGGNRRPEHRDQVEELGLPIGEEGMRLPVKLLAGFQAVGGKLGERTGRGRTRNSLSEFLDRPPKADRVDGLAVEGSAAQELQKTVG